MSDKTALWDVLGRTDPAHTKGFNRAGGFKGTAIKPIWSFRRMTEEFGPCGTGWGVSEPTFQVVNGSDNEVLVFCTASIWYEKRDQVAWGVGGDKAVVKQSSGLRSDDEAFKKAFTDAVTNALKMIGVGADVHMGLFDDHKYVAAMKEEFSEQPEAPRQPPKPADGTYRTAGGFERKPAPRLSGDDAPTIRDALMRAMDMSGTIEVLDSWVKGQMGQIDSLPDADFDTFKLAFLAYRKTLRKDAA